MSEKDGDTAFKRWYGKNKEKLSEKRRKAYVENKEYRERQKAQAKFHYWTKKRHATEESREVVLEAADTLRIDVTDMQDARYGTTVAVPAYSIGDVAKIFERSIQTIRLWEKRGVLPVAMYRNTLGRLWTEDQMLMFLELRDLLEIPSENFDDSLFAKEVKYRWEEMPQGLKLVERKIVDVKCPVCGHTDSVQQKETAPMLCPKCESRLTILSNEAGN